MTVTRKHYPTGNSGGSFHHHSAVLDTPIAPPGHITPRSHTGRSICAHSQQLSHDTGRTERQVCGSCPQCLTFWHDHMGLVHERQSRHENPEGRVTS